MILENLSYRKIVGQNIREFEARDTGAEEEEEEEEEEEDEKQKTEEKNQRDR